MTRSLYTWNLLITSTQIKINYACITAGKFTCQTEWYFWFALFMGFLAVFILVVCITNHCYKKKNAIASTDTPRIMSAINRHHNRKTKANVLNASLNNRLREHQQSELVIHQPCELTLYKQSELTASANQSMDTVFTHTVYDRTTPPGQHPNGAPVQSNTLMPLCRETP